jgi:hypothetical protein
MTTTLSTNTESFKFIDEFDINNKSYYDVTIEVKLLKYEDGNEFYDISYKFKYNHNNNYPNSKMPSSEMKLHPFVDDGCNFISESANGDIVYKNDLSTVMVKFLLMSDDELSKFTNNTTPQHYRKNIMLSLAKFWD